MKYPPVHPELSTADEVNTNRRWRINLLLGSLLIALFVIGAFLDARQHSALSRFDAIGRGSWDLVSFWSSSRLFWAGENPYDPELLLPLQAERGLTGEPVKITWNPPWFFLLFAPVLSYSLSTATVLLFAVNLLAVWGITALMTRGAPTLLRVRAGAVALCFLPTIHTLSFGQSSLVLTTLVVATIALYRRQCDWWCGLAFSLLSVKPHLLLLFGSAFGSQVLLARRWRVIGGMLLGLSPNWGRVTSPS